MTVITVADTGFGIAETDLAKIFQPFFTAKKRRGMGLGLPICQRIVKNHGGRIEVESQPGKGTTLLRFICLPSRGRHLIRQAHLKFQHPFPRQGRCPNTAIVGSIRESWLSVQVTR